MKIIHIISELEVGGAEMYLTKLLPRLQDGFDQEVCCLIGSGPVGEMLERRGIHVHYAGIASRFNPAALLYLYRYLRQKTPDAVISYLIYADVLTRLAGRLARVPHIISSKRSSYYARPYLEYFDALTRPLADAYVVQTDSAKRRARGIRRNKVIVIPNGVAVPSNPADLQRQKITYIANLKPGKGHSELIEAFKSIAPQHVEWKLVLAGTGPLENELKTQARDCSQIEFPGLVSNTTELLQTSSIFAIPSHAEGMSNALLEAMAAGNACIATDIPSNRELIRHGITGLITPARNVPMLSRNLERLMQDLNLRATLGGAARVYARDHHSLDMIADKWIMLITGRR